MIAVKLMGGLANQMFQYATGRNLSIKNRTELKLDAVSYFENQPAENTPRHYELNVYPIKATLMTREELKLVGADDQKRRGWRPRLIKPQPLVQFDEQTSEYQSFQPAFFNQPDNAYLVGHWQNEKYFKDIREELLKELTPKTFTPYTQGVLKEIAKTPSIALHVRRGDYVTNKHANKFHGLMSVSYYRKALSLIHKQTGLARVVVVSDDIAWCRRNLGLDKDTLFVDGNPTIRACEDIYIMRHCQHNIIANSSFSWWPAWLNSNPSKIVIAPKDWFKDKQANQKMHIVPEDWIRL